MEAIPFEQEVFAVATNFTLVPTMLPFEGLEIVTPAKANVAARRTTTVAVEIRACFFIWSDFLRLGFGLRPVKLDSSEGYTGWQEYPRGAKPPTCPGRRRWGVSGFMSGGPLYTGFY